MGCSVGKFPAHVKNAELLRKEQFNACLGRNLNPLQKSNRVDLQNIKLISKIPVVIGVIAEHMAKLEGGRRYDRNKNWRS